MKPNKELKEIPEIPEKKPKKKRAPNKKPISEAKKARMGRPTNVEYSLKKIIAQQADFSQAIQRIERRFAKFDNYEEKQKMIKEKKKSDKSKIYNLVNKSKDPVPKEYKETVRNILNKRFGIIVEALTDKPASSVAIVVPEKYSGFTEDEMEVMKVDLRTKVINYADGVNGVKEWAEKVYSSFNPEVQAQIVTDRKEAIV